MSPSAPELLDPARLREHLERHRGPLRRLVQGDDSSSPLPGDALGRSLGQSHAAVLDGLLSALFPAALAAADATADGIALAAVGGYGRGAMALGSDLDARLLCRDLDTAQRVAETLLYPLWDAGLDVGHQVVTCADLLADARQDLKTATALLDWRFIAGDRRLSEELRQRALGGIFSAAELPTLLAKLGQEVAHRHERFGGSVYMLEPDVKNGRGALRDLDVAWWVARARWNVGDLDKLVPFGLLVPRQLAAVEEARELLWRIRNILHGAAGRRSDRLSFDQQESIARKLGYGSRGTPPTGTPAVGEAVERLMSDYYRAARTISRFRELIADRAMPALKRRRPKLEKLGGGLQLFDGQATLARHELVEQEPAIVFDLIGAAVDHGVPLRPHLRGVLVEACGDEQWMERLRGSQRGAARFVELVTSKATTALKSGSIMRELHDIGLLLAMIPEFWPLVGRVHHHTYHLYTVDAHTVAAVDRLGEMVRRDTLVDDSQAERWGSSLGCQLASGIAQPRVLFFATLLHDVGKAIGRRDHTTRGAEMAPAILARLGFDPGEIEDVCRLIEHHLVMYHSATRRDLDDPATVEELAAVVRNSEALRNLYLLTLADLSTTSPTSMTSWKADLLDDLYVATKRFLSGHASRETTLREHKLREALALLAAEEGAPPTGSAEFVTPFVDGMPPRYALTSSPEAIVAHAKLVRRHLAADAVVSLGSVPSSRHGGSAICVVAPDQPGLLARITAALTASRLQVHFAQINSCALSAGVQVPSSNPLGAAPVTVGAAGDEPSVLAVDLFWVHHSSGAVAVERALCSLERHLTAVVGGGSSPSELVRLNRGASRRAGGGPAVPNRVALDNRASPKHSVVEVITRDRPGLLFDLSDVFFRQGLSIAVAKIATEGSRAVDVFYVSEP
ncbi:MAG: [protein-PII] uridylyltransferase, partial [Deltaproteobacteria bacterium]|nr:[protein-PII] uridylyltransferase [Deltaproteobacteria bacterium]